MISIIVPVYNVEKYLRRCLDSIMGQTYKALDIIVVDDGSTDGCGKICDEYAEKDSRIRVFHTENHGLSAARNVGLDNLGGKSEFIGFVDSDDWIEPDMYEHLLETSKKTGADLVSCSYWKEYPDGRKTKSFSKAMQIEGKEALRMACMAKISNCVWDKLWRRDVFDDIRFIEGRVYEDIAITHVVFSRITMYANSGEQKYHWIQHEKSLSHSKNFKCDIGHWLSYKDRFDFFESNDMLSNDTDLRDFLAVKCVVSAGNIWGRFFDYSISERKEAQKTAAEISEFVRENVPIFGNKGWKLTVRSISFFIRYDKIPSFILLYCVYKTYQIKKMLKRH